MTAGLESELKLAVGVRVMLRRNLDTRQGLVNGALGTVSAIGKDCKVTFDHTPKLQFKIERVRTGMAYVAMSRVRTLAGLYLLSFDPKSIKVSRECTEEVNRLRKLFRSDIPCIELSAVPNPMMSKPKLTGLTRDNIPPQPSTSTKEKVVCSGEHKTQATPSVGIVANPKIFGRRCVKGGHESSPHPQ